MQSRADLRGAAGNAATAPAGARHAAPAPLALRVTGISKSFPGVRALSNVDFDLQSGEVHGFVGANGAGKSTLIRILTGAETADTGRIAFPEAEAAQGGAAQAGQQIASIYQELTIVPEMTVLSNAFLGNMPGQFGLVKRRAMLNRFAALCQSVGASLPPLARAGSLSVADQQLVEILRAVLSEKRILIMDEPTAPLGPHECQKLYDLIGKLRADGVSILFVSHDLDEVMRLCDRISVMRDGHCVAGAATGDWTKERLVAAMLGDVKIEHGRKSRFAQGREILRVEGLTVPGRVHDMGFCLHRGEILGIAGLVGSGRTELLRALAGADGQPQGRMTVHGAQQRLPATVREAMALGIVMVPEDRKGQGLVLQQSGAGNLVLPDLASDAPTAVVSRDRRRRRTADLARRMGLDPDRLADRALNLSGGNQQKLVLGKWLNLGPGILLLDEPTRGIDLGAKQEIFRSIRDLSDTGMGVILVSSDIEEVIEHSDRVLVMAAGRHLVTLNTAQANMETILGHIFAVNDGPAKQETEQ
jgi:ABC-type sugar transport system ATPase subunit